MWHEHVESRMRGDAHVRFGGRAAETHRSKDRQGAAVRPLHHYRDPTRASHNFHIDQVSAGLALRLVPRPRLVLSEHTNNDTIRITNDSPLVEALAADCAPTWARTLSIQFDRWFRMKGGSWMHDPLTLSASLGLPFVTFGSETIRIGADGRIHRDPHGRPVQVSTEVDYPGFLAWMNHLVSTW